MKAESAISGPRGQAVRVALSPHNRSIVDLWLWRPVRGGPDTPVAVTATRVPVGHAVTISYRDRQLAEDLQKIYLPTDFATTVYYLFALHVKDRAITREVLRHTMRQVAHGVILCPPVSLTEKEAWNAAIDANTVFAERFPSEPEIAKERVRP